MSLHRTALAEHFVTSWKALSHWLLAHPARTRSHDALTDRGTFFAAQLKPCIEEAFMPDLTLADDELRDVVTALRSAAHRAMEVTSAQHCSPELRAAFADDRRRYNELAEKIDSSRDICSPPTTASTEFKQVPTGSG
jgi:hypothetical protein